MHPRLLVDVHPDLRANDRGDHQSSFDEVFSTSRHADQFTMKARLTTTDQASANFVAAAAIISSRPSWCSMHLGCDIHTASRRQTRTFDFASDTITGMIYFTLSIISPGLMRRWRQCIAEDLEQRLHVSRCYPTNDCEQYRRFCLHLF